MPAVGKGLGTATERWRIFTDPSGNANRAQGLSRRVHDLLDTRQPTTFLLSARDADRFPRAGGRGMREATEEPPSRPVPPLGSAAPASSATQTPRILVGSSTLAEPLTADDCATGEDRVRRMLIARGGSRRGAYAPTPLTPTLVLQAVTDWDIPAFGVR